MPKLIKLESPISPLPEASVQETSSILFSRTGKRHSRTSLQASSSQMVFGGASLGSRACMVHSRSKNYAIPLSGLHLSNVMSVATLDGMVPDGPE